MDESRLILVQKNLSIKCSRTVISTALSLYLTYKSYSKVQNNTFVFRIMTITDRWFCVWYQRRRWNNVKATVSWCSCTAPQACASLVPGVGNRGCVQKALRSTMSEKPRWVNNSFARGYELEWSCWGEGKTPTWFLPSSLRKETGIVIFQEKSIIPTPHHNGEIQTTAYLCVARSPICQSGLNFCWYAINPIPWNVKFKFQLIHNG